MTYLCTNGTAWDDFNFSKWYKLQKIMRCTVIILRRMELYKVSKPY